MLTKGLKSSFVLLCSLVLLAFNDKTTQAQDLDLLFSLGGSSNDCFVQCPMECPQLNLDMVDCVAYCKIKCACPADDTKCAADAMDKMQKSADERESIIGPDVSPEATESPESESLEISQAGASDSDAALSPESDEAAAGDLAFAAEDGDVTALSPAEALTPETETTPFVIEMDDASPSPSYDGAPTPSVNAGAPEASETATPQSAPAASTSPSPTPSGSIARTPQNAAVSPAPENAAAAPQIAAAASPEVAAAPEPNAPYPA